MPFDVNEVSPTETVTWHRCESLAIGKMLEERWMIDEEGPPFRMFQHAS
jgi:hypothetical protein